MDTHTDAGMGPRQARVRAIVLGAGRGKRMRPLTDTCPKPLLEADGVPMAVRQIRAIARAGVRRFVINTAHLASEFPRRLGDGASLGVSIAYSQEGTCAEQALETLGGIVRALPLLTDGTSPFIVAAGDIVTDFDYRKLIALAPAIERGDYDAHLILVPNPSYHPGGDMGLDDQGFVRRGPRAWTYSSLGIFSPRIFSGLEPVRAPLFPWLYQYADAGRVRGSVFRGRWHNIGTPQELAAFRAWQL